MANWLAHAKAHILLYTLLQGCIATWTTSFADVKDKRFADPLVLQHLDSAGGIPLFELTANTLI
jgi:hypothetical protein